MMLWSTNGTPSKSKSHSSWISFSGVATLWERKLRVIMCCDVEWTNYFFSQELQNLFIKLKLMDVVWPPQPLQKDIRVTNTRTLHVRTSHLGSNRNFANFGSLHPLGHSGTPKFSRAASHIALEVLDVRKARRPLEQRDMWRRSRGERFPATCSVCGCGCGGPMRECGQDVPQKIPPPATSAWVQVHRGFYEL